MNAVVLAVKASYVASTKYKSEGKYVSTRSWFPPNQHFWVKLQAKKVPYWHNCIVFCIANVTLRQIMSNPLRFWGWLIFTRKTKFCQEKTKLYFYPKNLLTQKTRLHFRMLFYPKKLGSRFFTSIGNPHPPEVSREVMMGSDYQ